MRHRIPPVVLAAVALAVLALTGCGGGGHPPSGSTKATPPPAVKRVDGAESCTPAAGSGVMGACTPLPSTAVQEELRSTRKQASSARRIPDVSEFQGHPNWRLASRSIGGAIVRVADGSHDDADFAYNWHELRALHVWHAAYFFLRPGDCASEARRAIALIKAQGGFDSGPLIADAEVPLPFFCAAQFSKAAEVGSGFHVCVIYTAPGTWPGGSNGGCVLWVATYGPRPGCVWSCTHVAWQYTDGQFGPFPHCIPGVGCDDISADSGITSIRVQRGPTKPQKVAALRGIEHRLHLNVSKRATLHALIDRHKCRAGQHAKPSSYHTVCGYWIREGNTVIEVEAKERKAIHAYHLEGVR